MKNILHLLVTATLVIVSPSICTKTGGAIFAQPGTLDTTFSGDGIDTTTFGGGYGQSVFIQPDKKIVVTGGGQQNAIFGVGIVRYNPNGGLDNTFGNNGKVYTDIGGIGSWGSEAARQSDGKIVVAGYTNTKSAGLFPVNIQNFLILRYNSDGSLDNSFGTNGSVITDFNQKNAQAASLAIQADGKIVISGVVDGGSSAISWDFALVRYNNDGTLDSSFGTAGKVITDFNGKNDIGNSIELQADGKIVVVGPVEDDSSKTHYGLARYTGNGSLDATFSNDGKLMTSITGNNDAAYSLAIQTDGKIIVTGGSGLNDGGDVTLVRYNTDGGIDSTFGTAGIVITPAGTAESRCFAIALQSDNKIVVSGVAADTGVAGKAFLVLRYNNDGSLDASFGNGGKVTTAIDSIDDEGYSVAIQPDKKIVVAGWTKDASDLYHYAVARYNGACEPHVITTSASITVCAGDTVNHTASGANTYSWSDGIGNGVGFIPAAIGVNTYTVIGTSSDNCKDTATTTITVNELPNVSANSTEKSICTGSSVTLTGSGASTYTWSNSISDGVSFTPTTTINYTLTGTSANSCTSTDTITVFVDNIPSVSAVSNASSVCAGASVTLNGVGASSYSWSSGITNGEPFAPTATATYTVTGSNGVCSDTATITITVNNSTAPNVTAIASNDTVCAGSAITLTGNGASSYTWSSGITDGVSFTPLASATYTVTGEGANNCSSTALIAITVDTIPNVIANSNTTIACSNATVILTGAGANSYTWTNGVSNNVGFIPTSTETYTVTGTDSNNCSATDTITVSVNTTPAPTITAVANKTKVCMGDSITLSGNGALTYAWSDGITNDAAFIPTKDTTYTVTGTDGNNCTGIDSISITVDSLPYIIANASAKKVCPNSSVTLFGSGADTYTWTSGVSDSVPFTPTQTMTYTVTGVTANCSNTDTVTIVIDSTSSLLIAKASAQTICLGDSVFVFAESSSTYTWSNGLNDSVKFAPTATATYTVSTTGTGSCTGMDTITIQVNSAPLNTKAHASDTIICKGDSVSLYGSGADGYLWAGGIENNKFFIPQNTATYTLTGTNTNNCSATANVTVSVLELPTITISTQTASICLGDSVLLYANGAKTYTWNGNGANMDSIIVSPLESTIYTVTGYDENMCINTASIFIPVDSCKQDITEITTNSNNVSRITIYPNPNSGNFTIRSSEQGNYAIINELGQYIIQFNLNNNNNYSIPISNIANGVYYLIGYNNNKATHQKIVVVK